MHGYALNDSFITYTYSYIFGFKHPRCVVPQEIAVLVYIIRISVHCISVYKRKLVIRKRVGTEKQEKKVIEIML